jgi:DNA polymerase III gamma/tau subunit
LSYKIWRGFYRDLLIAKTAPNRNDLVAVTPPTWTQLREFVQGIDVSTILQGQQHLKNSEAQIKNTTQPHLWLEVTLLGLLKSANPVPVASASWNTDASREQAGASNLSRIFIIQCLTSLGFQPSVSPLPSK